MTARDALRAEEARIPKIAAMLALAWTLVIAALVGWAYHRLMNQAEKMARLEAAASFEKDVIYRRWAASHGGVYVPATEQTPPSPYLSHVAERDIESPSGRRLTLVNPAYMTRQVHELGKQQFGPRGHITSLRPIRPENAPDPWEAEALRTLETGLSEVATVERMEGESYLRLMRPLTTEESCLKCHASQGYALGDLRGGISVTVPMEPHREIARAQMVPIGLGHGALWMLGLCGIALGARRLQASNRERERASEERARLEDQLRQSQKMEAVGQLAGGVAHDFNNLLQVMLGYLEIVSSDLGANHPRHNDLLQIEKAGRRAKSLVSQLLAFSRRQILRPQNVSLNVLIENFVAMLSRMIGEHIQFRFIPGEHVGTVYADKGMVEQALMNLCVNARDAMPQGGSLTIETKDRQLDLEICGRLGVAPGRYVQITVSDTGCGMDSTTKEKIFEPFFSTKGVDKGTGLGLPTVYGIVLQHRGAIDVESKVGAGTVFHIYLPTLEEVAPQKETQEKPGSKPGGKTILLADDNDSIREFGARLLRSAGYTVVTVADGVEALERFAESPEAFHLVLLDVAMPRLDGREVYKRIQERAPGTKVLFASGFADGVFTSGLDEKDRAAILAKPYTSEELLHAVRCALGQG
ncbi:MAG: DUF3365 domain-containing protein [Candidatus Hydrogenedentes bacterium]|nr:DUF3365 domain-containing protein [Candidatus Hydrogenedentota bacterium]